MKHRRLGFCCQGTVAFVVAVRHAVDFNQIHSIVYLSGSGETREQRLSPVLYTLIAVDVVVILLYTVLLRFIHVVVVVVAILRVVNVITAAIIVEPYLLWSVVAASVSECCCCYECISSCFCGECFCFYCFCWGCCYCCICHKFHSHFTAKATNLKNSVL